MDLKKVVSVMIAVSLLMAAAPVFDKLFNISLPPANQSMHDVEQSTQRNRSPGGAGLPGGANPYFPSTFPLPSPTVKR